MSTAADQRKLQAAQAAAALVEDGMLLGLGTGSTAALFVTALATRLANGSLHGVRGVPTSAATAHQAGELGIPLEELPPQGVDLAVDGMDELTASLDATKGLGGALLREKIVAAAAKRFVLIGDASKLVDHLGQRAPVPVEVARFGWRRTLRRLSELAGGASLRALGGEAIVTDNGNHIVDCRFDAPFDADALASSLDGLPGVLGHGLFLGMAHEALVAGEGGLRRLTREADATSPRAGGPQREPSGAVQDSHEVTT